MPIEVNSSAFAKATADKAMADKARYSRERTAHNKIFGEQTRRDVEKYYSVVRASRRWYEETIRARCRGRVALEYGCGAGSHSHFLARNGAARVVGIDISDVAIAQASASAASHGLATVEHRLMNAEELTFDADTFDLVCGTAILHHLDLSRALRELARTLKPAGAAVFLEPLGHNPIINLYRRLTPRLRTIDEHPLLMSDIAMAHRYFGKVSIQYFTLFTLCAVAFRNTAVFPRVLGLFEKTDAWLFRTVPFIPRLAWAVVLVFEQPIKPS